MKIRLELFKNEMSFVIHVIYYLYVIILIHKNLISFRQSSDTHLAQELMMSKVDSVVPKREAKSSASYLQEHIIG